MTEEEARAWLAGQFGNDAMAGLERIVTLVRAEAEVQNLVAPSTLRHIWNRHVLDSAQLVRLAGGPGPWLDIGTGAGFPGLVVAVLRREHMVLVEPRRLRADFLLRAVRDLALDHVEVVAARVETLTIKAAIISARAVAPAQKLLHAAAGCATTDTCWLLPRGRIDEIELADLRRHWRGEFHVKQSLSDPASSVLVIEHLTGRAARR